MTTEVCFVTLPQHEEGIAPMSAYQTLKDAIEKKSAVTFTFHGEAGFGSPHSLGTGDGEERVLLYRGDDAHEKEIPPQGKWSCIRVQDLTGVHLLPTIPFHSGHPDESHLKGLHKIDVSV
ncbi:hypothetical protein [Gluconobacter roseus]